MERNRGKTNKKGENEENINQRQTMRDASGNNRGRQNDEEDDDEQKKTTENHHQRGCSSGGRPRRPKTPLKTEAQIHEKPKIAVKSTKLGFFYPQIHTLLLTHTLKPKNIKIPSNSKKSQNPFSPSHLPHFRNPTPSHLPHTFLTYTHSLMFFLHLPSLCSTVRRRQNKHLLWL